VQAAVVCCLKADSTRRRGDAERQQPLFLFKIKRIPEFLLILPR
jgi:hypothetical protein